MILCSCWQECQLSLAIIGNAFGTLLNIISKCTVIRKICHHIFVRMVVFDRWFGTVTNHHPVHRFLFLTHTREYHLGPGLEVFGTSPLAPGGSRAWAPASPSPTARRRPSPPSSSGAATGGSQSSVVILFMIIITMPGSGLTLSLITSQSPCDSTDNKKVVYLSNVVKTPTQPQVQLRLTQKLST